MSWMKIRIYFYIRYIFLRTQLRRHTTHEIRLALCAAADAGVGVDDIGGSHASASVFPVPLCPPTPRRPFLLHQPGPVTYPRECAGSVLCPGPSLGQAVWGVLGTHYQVLTRHQPEGSAASNPEPRAPLLPQSNPSSARQHLILRSGEP